VSFLLQNTAVTEAVPVRPAYPTNTGFTSYRQPYQSPVSSHGSQSPGYHGNNSPVYHGNQSPNYGPPMHQYQYSPAQGRPMVSAPGPVPIPPGRHMSTGPGMPMMGGPPMQHSNGQSYYNYPHSSIPPHVSGQWHGYNSSRMQAPPPYQSYPAEYTAYNQSDVSPQTGFASQEPDSSVKGRVSPPPTGNLEVEDDEISSYMTMASFVTGGADKENWPVTSFIKKKYNWSGLWSVVRCDVMYNI